MLVDKSLAAFLAYHFEGLWEKYQYPASYKVLNILC